MCLRSGRHSLPNLRLLPGPSDLGGRERTFLGGTSGEAHGRGGPERAPWGRRGSRPRPATHLQRRRDSVPRNFRGPHLLPRPPAEMRAGCISALQERSLSPHSSLLELARSWSLALGTQGHAHLRAGTRRGAPPSPVFSLAILSPARRQPRPQTQGSQNLETEPISFSEALIFSLGFRQFCPQKYISGVPALPPRD